MRLKNYLTMLACMVGMSAWALEPVDGVYQLATAQDLVDFAELINAGGTTDVKAVLTADIDMSDYPTCLIGNDRGTPFSGEFDGQGHTIKLAISVENTGDYSGALFRFVKDATFQNLHLTGSVTTAGKHPASLASAISGVITLTKVTSDCDIFTNGGDACMGGLVGIAGENGDGAPQTELTFNYCVFTGNITHTGEDIGQNHGGSFVGWKGNKNTVVTINSSYAMPKSITNSPNFSTFVRFWGGQDNGQIMVNNSYYLNNIEDYAAFQGEAASMEMFQSGEVCYYLNGKQTQGQTWFQNIGEDEVPVLDPTHKTVYANGTVRCDGAPDAIEFSNTYSDSPVAPPHTFKEGICQVCGTPDETYAERDADGFVLLDTPEKIVWFAAMVEKKDNALNAKLTDDINMGSVEDFAMIGSDEHPYCGTFDGQDHFISYLTLEKTQNFVGFFSTVGDGVHVTHLILDNTCSIFSTGNRVGMVGAAHRQGTVLIDYCGNEGNVTSTSPFESTAGGIFGCNVDCLADIHIDHCYSTGVIDGMNQSAQIAGWLNYFGNSSMTNCWSVAEVRGYDNEGAAMARHSGQRLENNFSTIGQGRVFAAEEVMTGELCYKMNGSTLSANPAWYQTIGVDDMPTWKEDHGLVFQSGEGEFDCMADDESFENKRALLLDAEALFTDDMVATHALVEDFQAYLEELSSMGYDDLLANYSGINTLKAQLNESARAYADYQKKVDEVMAFIEESPELSGTYLDFLKAYLEDILEPGDYPNGTYPYIMENMLPSTEEILAETEYVELLRRQAVEGGYVKDSDISNLLVNPEFANWYEGWEKELNCSRNSDVIQGRHISETWNGTYNIHQTLTGMKPGIYEVQIQASYRPGFQPASTNLSGMIYMNDQNVYIMSSYEGRVLAADAVDGENCYLNMEDALHDMIIYDVDEPAGYVPRGTTGAYYAYKAGRYQNRLICLVGEDGTLTVGLKDEGSGGPEDETAWAEMKLIYRGTIDEASDAIDETLQGMVARATTLLEYECDVDFSLYPNFGNELRTALQNAIDAVGTATTGEQKYELVETFSTLFRDVYDCKRAYRAFNQACAMYEDGLVNLQNEGFDFGEEGIVPYINQLYDIQDQLFTGGYTHSEARSQAAIQALPYYSAIFGEMPYMANGFYEIDNFEKMVWVKKQINAGNTNLNIALTEDIDLSEHPTFMLAENKANSFTGVFDGQGHTIKLAINVTNTGDYSGALFRFAQDASFRNLNMTGSVTTCGKHPASLVSCLFGTGTPTISNVTSSCDIFTNGGDACMSGLVGILGDIWNDGRGIEVIFNNCGFTGNITHTGDANAQNHGGSFIGWKAVDNATVTMNNCYAAPKSANSPRFSTFVRVYGSDNGQEYANNCYFLSGVVDYVAEQGTEASAEEFANGTVCYALNGDQSAITWYQKIGEDPYPVLEPTHGKVVKNEDGTYSTVTSVDDVIVSKTSDGKIYNLSGQRVEKAVKGLYIIDGKKILVK